MGRAVKDAKLDRRDARVKLAVQKEPYWRLISEGAHLGYYRGTRVGKWVARYKAPGSKGGYAKKTLGEADSDEGSLGDDASCPVRRRPQDRLPRRATCRLPLHLALLDRQKAAKLRRS